MKLKDWIKRLSAYKDQEQEICIALWIREDIYQQAEQNNIYLNNIEAEEILAQMERQQDCNHGITWETIDNLLYKHNKETKQ